MCPVLRSATAIKMKSRDQAHRQATIKGSIRLLDQKSDQNQDNFAMSCILLNICYKLSTVVHQSRKRATDCFQLWSATFSRARVLRSMRYVIKHCMWVCHSGRNNWVWLLCPYNIIVYAARSNDQEYKSLWIKDQKVH